MNCNQWCKRSIALGFFFLIFSQSVLADPCSDAFPDVVQSHVVNKTVAFTCGTQIINSVDNALPITNVVNPSSCSTKTCGTIDCVPSAQIAPVLEAGAFQVSSKAGGNETVSLNGNKTLDGNDNQVSDYDSVTINFSGQLNFSRNTLFHKTKYRIYDLTMADTSILHLKSGDYWIENLTVLGHSTITTDASEGSVRLFIKNFVNSGGGELVWNENGLASDLLIYTYSDFTIGGVNSIVKALIYSQGNVVLQDNASVTGAINALDTTFNGTSSISFDQNSSNNATFGFMCPFPEVVYFEVTSPEIAINCQKLTVTVTARDEVDQVVTDYTGTILLDTLANHKGTWDSTTGGGTFIGDNVHGTATYEFVPSDNGVVSFEFNYPPTGTNPIVIKVDDVDNGVILGFSLPINYLPPGFVITDYIIPPGTTTIASDFSSPQIAGTEFTLYLTAFKKNQCQVNTNFKGNKNIKMWTEYINPATGTMTLLVNGSSIAIGESAPPTTQNLNFVEGVASVLVRYDDAGKLMLSAQHTEPSGPRGSTGHFVVKPSEFVINVPGNTAAQISSPVNAAVSACLNNTVFKKAGEAFSVNIQPRNALGGVTPNYGNETFPEGILLNSGTLLAPNPGQNGSTNTGVIGNGSAFVKVINNPGPFSEFPYFSGSNFSFDEVGCIELAANVASGNYLGAGSVTGSIVVGRFIPDHFNATKNSPKFTTACDQPTGGFTYLEQPFFYETQPIVGVTAHSLNGAITQNYTGGFWRLSDSDLGAVYNKAYYPLNVADTIPDLVLASSPPTLVDNGNGTGEFHFIEGVGVRISKMDDTLVPPFTAEIQLQVSTITDSDGVPCTGSGCNAGGVDFGETTVGNGIAFSGATGGNTFYHGRLALTDVSGSELLAGVLPMRIEYYTSAHGFSLNEGDSCTVFGGGATDLLLEPTPGLATSATLPVPPDFQNGVMNITLSAPNLSGYVDVEADLSSVPSNLPWLQYNWPYEGTNVIDFSLNPRGRYTFGIFRGGDNIIYKKENHD